MTLADGSAFNLPARGLDCTAHRGCSPHKAPSQSFAPTVSAAMGGNQRAAIVAVGLFFVVGLALLTRVRAGGPTAARLRAACP